MRIEEGGLALLQDLALIYLGLAQGADHDLDPAESKEMASRLRRWMPNRDPALIDHVIRDVSLSYNEATDADEVYKAVESLGQKLSESVRHDILDDLAGIARADGAVLEAEKNFIRRVADIWDVQYEDDIEEPPA